MPLYKAKINIAYDCEDAPCAVVVHAETKACEDVKSAMKRVNALRDDFRDMGYDLKATIANYAKIETDEKGNEDAIPLMTVFYDEGTFREGGDYRSWVLTDGESIGVLLNAFKALTVQTRPYVPKHGERIIRVIDLQNYNFKQADEVLSAEGVSSTVTAYAGGQEGHDVKILVPCDKGKYYLEAKEGDGMWHSWEGARGAVQKGCSPTILTSEGGLGVATFGKKENER